jgi:hypothetical protein
LKKLLLDKASGLDEIPNEILTALNLKILKGLTYIINKNLVENTLLNCFKKLIIIILRKENKKDYSFSSSYQLIALENTLIKVINKVFIIRLSRAIEEYTLLL